MYTAGEYAYRYQSEYQLVWWVPADQSMLVRPVPGGPALLVDEHLALVEVERCGAVRPARRGRMLTAPAAVRPPLKT